MAEEGTFTGATENIFKVGVGACIAIGVINFVKKVGESTKAKKENSIKWF